VVPCFNEKDVIPLTYYRLLEVLGKGDFRLQVVFVDDGSHDGTSEMVANISRRDSQVKTILLSRNFRH